uniref:Uncharacterized protein n=1 Tax=Timema bartmani TaxID=61472 RepID=A0A7R9ESQ8_9NEOP|nr:unnamed protein product [Timema bartmani]
MVVAQVELLYPETGREEIDPEKLWTTVLKVVRAAVQNIEIPATSKEEADSRKGLRIMSAAQSGLRSIMISSVDMDVFVILIVRDTVGPPALDRLDIHQPTQVLGLYGEYPIATPEPKLSFLKAK